MWFFKRRKLEQIVDAQKDAEIQAIKVGVKISADEAERKINQVNKLLDSRKNDIALNLFLATGGERRIK